jgi:prepilin-type processing-associated H-X9-DG protein
MELLVVTTIIGILVALLFPSLSGARASSRKMACRSNLKQFAVGMLAHAERHGTLCSGAFDWNRDGCVTEVGWVADLVNTGTLVGEMLCPSNPGRISVAYHDLLNLPTGDLRPESCVDHYGSPPITLPDGRVWKNPCRTILEDCPDPTDPRRRQTIERQIYMKSYNTNYTASWFLVRSGVSLDDSGNLKSGGACNAALKARVSTIGPLEPARVDSGNASPLIVPLLGCGGAAGILTHNVGPHGPGELMVKSFTNGPVLDPSMLPPSFASGTPQTGPTGWWATWNNDTLQDYRSFAPVHRGACNVLFADGSVRALLDRTGDGMLNNGFSAGPTTGFATGEPDVSEEEIFSRWSFRAQP